MGSHYRERHAGAATTTSDDIAGLTGKAEVEAEVEDELANVTLAQLRDQAADLGLPTYGTKAEVYERIEAHQNSEDSSE